MLVLCVLASGALPTPALADGRADWWVAYGCARVHADSAYHLAGVLLRSGQVEASRPELDWLVQAARTCLAGVSAAPEALTRWEGNLAILIPALVASRTAGTSVANPPPKPSTTETLSRIVEQTDLGQRPISEAAVRGSIIGMDTYAEWLGHSLAFRTDATEETLKRMMALQESLIRRDDYAILYEEYRALRAELDSLARFRAERAPRLGLGIAGYEQSVIGAGPVSRFGWGGIDFLAAGHGLAQHADEWRFGLELGAGLRVADVAILPGILWVQSAKPALTGSIMVLRPGDLAMGISFSSVQGLGLKMIVGW